MAYRIAGIDVHKAMLAVVVADVEVEGDWHFERGQFGATPSQLRLLTGWLGEQAVEEVVMESTAQYWRPVWDALERDWQPTQRRRVDAGPSTGALHLAQTQSNHGRHGRKRDFPDAERLSARVEDPARRRHLRGTRSGGQPSAGTASRRKDASRTP